MHGHQDDESPTAIYWYWNGQDWAMQRKDMLPRIKPDIVAFRYAGQGSLDPRLTIAVGDVLSREVVKEQHKRFRKEHSK